VTKIVIAGLALLAWICLPLVTGRLWSRRDKDKIYPDQFFPLWLKRVVLVIALVALPATAVLAAGPFVACVGGGIDVDVARHDGECLGVTDGRYKFSGGFIRGNVGDETRRRLDRVEDLIKGQNDIQGDSVKVAFLAPLTSPLAGPRAVDELEGAAAAQRWINKDGRGSPKIRLLVAHMGSSGKQWSPVVQRLIAMKDGKEPLVAVVGVGLSQEESKWAARGLAQAGIPMVAGSLTATKLDPDNPIIKGFHQVSHANEQQIDALFHYLRDAGVDLRNGVVVQSDDVLDSYAMSSAEAFKSRLSLDLGYTPVSRLFGDPNGDQGKLGNQFALISQSLCRDRKVVVFYAGRSRFLSNFMQKLDAEQCVDSALVVSASDATVLRMRSGDETAQQNWGIGALGEVLGKGKVSLVFTPVAVPELLKDRPQFKELASTFRDEGFNENDLRTRWAITSWDALRVVAEWVWRAQVAVNPELPHADDVARTSTQRFTDLKDPYQGASGDFWFDQEGHRGGDPPLVVRLMADGSVRECPVRAQNANASGGGC
jgi:ABC-type branched-subunit amino acid transport system substrate-binding protein